jgi:sialic acid synthase SpsE
MCYLNDIELAVKSIKDECNNTITLLHCTTNYPCPLDQVNLGAMLTMKEKFSNEIIGYSDHTV